MSTGIVTRRKSAMHIDNSYGIDVVTANTNLVSKRVLKGEPFSTQIVCDEGYSIYEITIKMGGVDITSTAYDPTYNMISIPSVTDDVDIECYAMHTMPSDYVRVDGIKAKNAASYLDTGYKVTPNSRLEIKMTLARYNVYTYYAGSKNDNSTKKGSGWYTDTATPRYVKVYNNLSDRISTGLLAPIDGDVYQELILDYYKKTHSVRGGSTVSITEKTSVDDDNFHLFRPLTGSGSLVTQSSPNTIGYFHIYDYSTNAYVRYYIPCLNASGVAGFWDAARGVFQGSSNSTAFEAWIEGGTFNKYAADGLWAMYDGIDNAGIGTHDSSATTWKDLAEHENDATIVSTVTWESNGWTNSSDKTQLVLAPNTTIQALRDSDFTIDYTIKPTVVDYRALSGNYNGGSAAFLYVFIASNRVYFRTGSSTTLNTNQLDLANTNHTITVRRKGVEFSIFVDGQLVAKANKVKDVFTANDSKYWIGAYFASQYTFRGKFYANRLYSKALSDEQIKFNHRIDVNRFGFYQTT